MLRARLWSQSKSQERLPDFSRSINFLHSHKDSTFLYKSGCWQHRYYITKVTHWRKDVLEGHDIKVKIFARLTSLFYLFNETPWKVFIIKTVGRVFDCDIIFRDQTYFVFCFLNCVMKFQTSEAKISGREARAQIQAIEFVFFSSFFLSFLSYF